MTWPPSEKTPVFVAQHSCPLIRKPFPFYLSGPGRRPFAPHPPGQAVQSSRIPLSPLTPASFSPVSIPVTTRGSTIKGGQTRSYSPTSSPSLALPISFFTTPCPPPPTALPYLFFAPHVGELDVPCPFLGFLGSVPHTTSPFFAFLGSLSWLRAPQCLSGRCLGKELNSFPLDRVASMSGD